MATFYISSTFSDLKECRASVGSTLQRMGHRVIGMENYTAEGRAPLKKCLADVSGCDAYIGIFAWRYGHIPTEDNPKKKAITELEYREARRLNKEPLIFLLSNDAPWPGDRYADDEKERKRIKALREELSQSHTVSFFKDCADLANLVGIVASRFPVDEKPRPVPPPPPPPPPPRPAWYWYGLILVAALVLIYPAYRLKLAYWPSLPSERTNPWEARFTPQLDEQWQYPRNLWDTEAGEATKTNSQLKALLVKGREMGVPNDLGDKVFYNFRAVFKIRFKSGIGAAWVLRAQSDKQSGYLFEINKIGSGLILRGWIYEGNRKGVRFADDTVGFDHCCSIKHDLIIDVTVQDNSFKYIITFEDDDETDSQAGNTVTLPYSVEGADFRWRWGTFGFLGTEDGSIMKVEDLKIIPLPRKTS